MIVQAKWTRWCLALLPCLLLWAVPEAGAAEGGGNWRPTYDLIMRWVNFIILAALLVKFVRVPLVNFVKGRQAEISAEIKDLEEQRQAAEAAIKDAEEQLAASSSRLETIKERIVSEGQARKAEIIADAQKDGEMMLAAARLKVDGQIQRAKDQLRAEMVDLAVEQALQRLPGLITEEDNRRILETYMAAAQSK
ncbi:MAG: F0F1 ATP synthase subunit B [Desulfobacterales bacterium]